MLPHDTEDTSLTQGGTTGGVVGNGAGSNVRVLTEHVDFINGRMINHEHTL